LRKKIVPLGKRWWCNIMDLLPELNSRRSRHCRSQKRSAQMVKKQPTRFKLQARPYPELLEVTWKRERRTAENELRRQSRQELSVNRKQLFASGEIKTLWVVLECSHSPPARKKGAERKDQRRTPRITDTTKEVSRTTAAKEKRAIRTQEKRG